jgi:hypothetical protein
MSKEYAYTRIDDETYNKRLWQLRTAVMKVQANFEIYGLDPLARGSVNELIRLAEDFSMAVRGKPMGRIETVWEDPPYRADD